MKSNKACNPNYATLSSCM